jgi:hypothetical protein
MTVRSALVCSISLHFALVAVGPLAFGREGGRQTSVVSVAPREGAAGVDLETFVQVHFSTGLALRTVTADSVRLLDSAGVVVPAQLGFDLEGDVVNLQPNTDLKPQHMYTLEVTFAFKADGTSVIDNRALVDEENESLRFAHPLDVAVHPTGRFYVADFGDWSTFGGGGAIWVLNSVR